MGRKRWLQYTGAAGSLGGPIAGSSFRIVIFGKNIEAWRNYRDKINFEQIPALAERGKKRVTQFHSILNERLGESEYVAGDYYTIADVTAQVSLDFGIRAGLEYLEDKHNIARWHGLVNARPSASV